MTAPNFGSPTTALCRLLAYAGLTLALMPVQLLAVAWRWPLRQRLPHWYHQRTRSEEHTSELQSLMRISYAVFCLKKKKSTTRTVCYDHTDVKATLQWPTVAEHSYNTYRAVN